MEINQLRIGNLIHRKRLHSNFNIKPGFNVITEDILIKIITYETVKKAISPVLLTGSLIKKLGFRYYKSYQEIENPFELDDAKVRWIEINIFKFNDDISFHIHPNYNFLAIKCLRLDCNFVHELQNYLYYFNQTELSLKEI